MAVTTKILFPATSNSSTTDFSLSGLQLNNQDDLDVYVTKTTAGIAANNNKRILHFRQSTSSNVDANHNQVNNTDGLYFPAITHTGGTETLENYTLVSNNSVVRFNSALPSGAIVFVERRTRDADSAYTSFASGSTVRATDLNNSSTESNFTAQEARNKAFTIEGVLFNGNQPSTNFITSSHIVNGAVAREDIANDAIDGTKLADDSINSEHYVDGSIDAAHLSDDCIQNRHFTPDCVDSADIAAGAIDLEHMSANSVDSDQYVDGSIDRVHISADAIDGTKIADDSINSEHYVDRSIDTQHIGGSQVTTNELANNAVTTIKINDLNVTRDKIANDAINGTKIADDCINSEHYVDGSIDAIHLSDDCIQNRHFTPDCIDSADINAGALDNEHYAAGSITSDKLNAATVITSSEQASATTNDTSFLTSAAADARFFNISSGDTIKDGQTFPDNDTTIATTAAINDRIIDLIDDIGGFSIIASEQHFPNTNPQGTTGKAAILSIKAASTTLNPNASNQVIISSGNLANNADILIANVPSTIPQGFGFLVESTSTIHEYSFHRLVPKATEVTTVAGIASNITTVAGVASNVTTVAGISSNVTSVAGNATNINTVASNASNINAVAADAADIGVVAADGTDIGLVAGSITNVNNVGGSIANVNTVASNLSSVNSFADRYRVAGSAPTSSLDAGDLYFDTSSNELRVYNGSSWQGGVTATGNLAGLGANTFTGNQTISSVSPNLIFTDTNHDSDFKINVNAGLFQIYDVTNDTYRIKVASDGTVDIAGNLDANGGLDVTGNITVTGNVDGRDIAADGASLDNIESGAIGTDVTNGDIELTPNGTGVVEIKGAGGNDGTLQLNCSQNSHGVKIKSPAHSAGASYTLTLPVNDGAQDEALITDGNGNLSFSNRFMPLSGGSFVDTVTFAGTNYNAFWNKPHSRFDLNDNVKITFGTSQDLTIFHNGSDSVISQVASGTGDLKILSGGAQSIECVKAGAVNIAHNGSTKLATTSGGVSVTGNITVSGTVDGIDIATDVAANTAKVSNATHTGDVTGSTALTIANDAVTFAKVQNISTARMLGNVSGSTGDIQQLSAANVRTFINVADGATNNGSGSLSSYLPLSGGTLTGALTGTKLVLVDNGASSPILDIKTDDNSPWGLRLGNDSYSADISDGFMAYQNNNGNLYFNLYGNSAYENWYFQTSDGSTTNTAIHIDTNRAVKLAYQNATRVATTTSGVTITGTLVADGVSLGDSDNISLGNGGDFQIRHDGSNNWVDSVANHPLIVRAGTGDLYLQGSDLFLGNEGATKKYIDCHEDAAVELYENNTLLFRTGVSGQYGSVQTQNGHGGWGGYSIGGNYVFMSDGATVGIYNDIDNEWMIDCYRNSYVRLRHNGSNKLETTSSGVTITGTCTATSFSGDGSGLTGVSAGKVKQIVKGTLNGSFGTGSSSYQATGCSVTITTTGGKVLIMAGGTVNNTSAGSGAFTTIYRGSTNIADHGTHMAGYWQEDNSNNVEQSQFLHTVDSPSAGTYTYQVYIYAHNGSGTAYWGYRNTGVITAMEIES